MVMAFERRLDRLALDQLRQVAAAQAEEIERLRDALWRAEEHADFCQEQWRELEAQVVSMNSGMAVGITQLGNLTLVHTEEKPESQS